MKNIDFKAIIAKVTKNLSLAFLAAFFVLLILEGLEVRNSIKFILDVAQEPVTTGGEKGVRINFDNYNEVVKRIAGASTFKPVGGIQKDPFSVSANPSPAPAPGPTPAPGASPTPPSASPSPAPNPDDSSGLLKLE